MQEMPCEGCVSGAAGGTGAVKLKTQKSKRKRPNAKAQNVKVETQITALPCEPFFAF